MDDEHFRLMSPPLIHHKHPLIHYARAHPLPCHTHTLSPLTASPHRPSQIPTNNPNTPTLPTIPLQTDDALIQSVSLPSLLTNDIDGTGQNKGNHKDKKSNHLHDASSPTKAIRTFTANGTNTSDEDLFVVSMEKQLAIDWSSVDLPPKW